MGVTRIAFRSAARAAAVTMLEAYAADEMVKLQVYPGRPRSINAPCAFVDKIRETFVYTNVTWRLRTPIVDIIILHGYFDSKEAVDQADAFGDGFLDWVTDNYHAAGANTMVGITAMEDDPNYVPDWMPPEQQRTYYATLVSLEGFAGG